jgi:hypothetical protein
VLAEREATVDRERLISVYTWGPMGIVARRGVSVRNGAWDDEGGSTCGAPPEPEGAFVAQDSNIMSDYTYMLDHMGNVAALVDSDPGSPTFGTARQQVFDAFGNNIEGYATFQCVADHDSADLMVHPLDPPCPLPPAQPIERMQTGGLNWRGGEHFQISRLGPPIGTIGWQRAGKRAILDQGINVEIPKSRIEPPVRCPRDATPTWTVSGQEERTNR